VAKIQIYLVSFVCIFGCTW